MEIVHSPTDNERLFGDDGQPLARHTDPPTSHEAAPSQPRRTAGQRAVLKLLIHHLGGSGTDPQIEQSYRYVRDCIDAGEEDDGTYPRQPPSSLRTRRAELVRAGLVQDSGQRGLTPTGRACVIWTLTDAGWVHANRRSVA